MNLHFVLGDQLNEDISCLTNFNKNKDIVFMCEVWDEATYVKHHKKKIAFIFSAMRHFAKDLAEKGVQVHYVKLGEGELGSSFESELKKAVNHHKPIKVIMTEPSEYRVLQSIKAWDVGVPIEIRSDERFLCKHKEFAQWAEGRKQLRMEFFYREMRKKYQILMDGDKPCGGAWNYDSENRKPPKSGLDIPPTYSTEVDEITQDVMDLVAKRFAEHFGDLEPFHFAVNRHQALEALSEFISRRLSNFGDYQDAMIEGEPWLYHSHISFYINCGLLEPMECIKAAEQAYRSGEAPLNAVEGFVRQILGWREYVRGIYWLKMPDYQQNNFLQAKRQLPDFFWGKDTNMNCLKQCVQETRQNAYAHHIQRLMVLGNFALLAGLDPDEVNEWYLIVYADAYQWVELPNVTGMILFADEGLLGSKPYAASGAYINKMSDYCRNCEYSVSTKTGTKACPFNYLYWNFLLRNKDKLENNHRLRMIYSSLNRMKQEKVEEIKADSQRFLAALENNEKV